MKVIQKYKKFKTQTVNFSSKTEGLQLSDGFVVKLQLKNLPMVGEKFSVLEIPNVLSVFAVGFNKNAEELTDYERAEGDCFYAKEDGYSPVLKARIYINSDAHPDWRQLEIGVPLNLINALEQPVYIHYDGVIFRFIYNGEEVNSESPFGNVLGKDVSVTLNDSVIETFGIAQTAFIQTEDREEEVQTDIRLYSPRGYNAWAGDTVNFYHDGTYHLLYFFDRHHHGSRFGCGAHAMNHLTTQNFIDWVDHGRLFDLEEQWQSVGTGMMFYYKNRYYYVFGYHTERVYGADKLASVKLREGLTRNGYITGLTHKEIREKGLFPDGANYVWSDDGIRFNHGGVEFHMSENPAVYPQKDGSLVLYGGYGGEGTWVSDEIDKGWRLAEANFPPCFKNSALRHSSECPSFFEKNGYKYLLIGFAGFYRTEKNSDVFNDVAAKGEDVYDGLNVPMVTKTDDGRLILSGWLGGMGWASFIAHRELIQTSGGRLNMRWLKEFTPNVETLKKVARLNSLTSGTSFDLERKKGYYIECEVNGEGIVSVVFKDGDKACRLFINRATGETEIKSIENGQALDSAVLPLTCKLITQAENYETLGCCHELKTPHLHYRSTDFSVLNKNASGGKYVIKIMIHYSVKSDGSVIDAEINGERTMISNRIDFVMDRVEFHSENADITKADIYEL